MFNTNVNFEVLFGHIEDPYKQEILNFIKFIKSKPPYNDFSKYNLSDKSKKIILEFIDEVLSKIKE